MSSTLTEPKIALRQPVSAHDEAIAPVPVMHARPAPKRPAGPPALHLEGVSKTFVVGRKKKPVVAIADVSLRVERGEIYGVLGANGSGKSTLIRLVSTLLTLDRGRAEVFGHDVERDEMAVKRLINRVSVDAAFFKKLSPYENLAFAARLYGLHAGEARAEAVRILARLGIAEKRMGSPIEQMSRGMQQKVAIARALLTSPDAPAARRADDGARPPFEARGPVVHRGGSGGARRHDPADHARHGRGGPPLRPDRDPRRGRGSSPRTRRTASRPGSPARRASRPTLDNVFLTYTGRSLDEDVDEAAPEDDE